MSFVDAFLPEFDHEMENTRKILALVTDDLLDWKAHDSLNSIGWVAAHLADTVSWTEVIVKEDSFDVAPVDGPPHQTPMFEKSADILAAFDKHLAEARPIIAAATDQELMVAWSLLQGGQTLFAMPRMAVLKTFLINHIVHHRAFLIAYLRMNNIACPGMYD